MHSSDQPIATVLKHLETFPSSTPFVPLTDIDLTKPETKIDSLEEIKRLRLYGKLPETTDEVRALIRICDIITRFNRLKGELEADNIYTLKSTKRLLANPNSQDEHLLMPENEKFFRETIEDKDRINTGLASSSQEYSGGWHYQSLHGTCAAWALAHGLLCHGHQIDPTLLTTLLNAAIDNQGLNFEVIKLALDLVPTGNLELTAMSAPLISTRSKDLTFDHAAYCNNQELPERLLADVLGKIAKHQELMERYFQFKFDSVKDASQLEKESALKQNAVQIKSLLDEGTPIYISVSASYLMTGKKAEGRDNHAVIISGYRLEDGKMDLQIIDSSNGIYWVSLEHLSASINHYSISKVIDVKEQKAEEELPACYLTSSYLEFKLKPLPNEFKLKEFSFGEQ